MLALPDIGRPCADAPAANPIPSGNTAELPKNFRLENELMPSPPP
jgi:hypothetical protein